MDNRVGTGLDPDRAKLLRQQLLDITAELRAVGVSLLPEERARLSRPRAGSEAHARTIARLVAQRGLSLPETPINQIEEDLALIEQLRPLAELLQAALQLVRDTIDQAESEYWEGFLLYRGVLSSLAARLPEVAAEIKEVDAFLGVGRRRPRPPTP